MENVYQQSIVRRPSFSLKFVLSAAYQSCDICPMHQDDQQSIGYRGRDHVRESHDRPDESVLQPDKHWDCRCGNDRAERNVTRQPNNQEKKTAGENHCQRRQAEKDSDARRYSFAAAKTKPNRETVTHNDRQCRSGNKPVNAVV